MNDGFAKCYFYITEKKLPRNCILAPIVNHWDSIIDLYAVYTIYILLPYSKIMRLLQFHQMFQIWCSKNGRRKESSPNCLPVVVDQQKSLIDVRFASPLHIHTYLSLCGFQSLAPISLPSSSSSTSSSSSCSLT